LTPVFAETLTPLAHFVEELPKDSSFADEAFLGLRNQEFIGPYSIT
jgi:hypothetical protein